VLSVHYDAAHKPTTISDTVNGTWCSAGTTACNTFASVQKDDGTGTGHVGVSMFVKPNATAGNTMVTISFGTNIEAFSFTIDEIQGTSGVVDKFFTGNPTGNTVSTNAQTTTVNGDLILVYASTNGDPFNAKFISPYWVAGTNFDLLDANIATGQGAGGVAGTPHAMEYWVQPTAGAVTPSITATQTTNSAFIVVAIALKPDPTQGSPAAPGAHINNLSHYTPDVPPTSYKIQFPSSGTFIVLTCNENSACPIVSISDNHSNTWVAAANVTDTPQVWYTSGTVVTARDLLLTVTLSAGAPTHTYLLYDLTGLVATPFTGTACTGGSPVTQASCTTDGGGSSHAATITNQPTFTPNKIGIVFASMKLGIGPTNQFAAGTPSGAAFDVITYSNQVDGSIMDNSDARSHFINPDLTTENWNYTLANTLNAPCTNYPSPGPNCETSYSSTAVVFGGQPLGPNVDTSTVQLGTTPLIWRHAAPVGP
jgi:hypothetical protein